MVSVTTESGISFIVPSNSRNRATRPLRARPAHCAVAESGRCCVIVDMLFSILVSCCKDQQLIARPTASESISKTGSTSSVQHAAPTTLLPGGHSPLVAVALEAVELHPDMSGFGRTVRQRNGTVEGDARLLVAIEQHQQRAAHAEEIEVVRQPAGERR